MYITLTDYVNISLSVSGPLVVSASWMPQACHMGLVGLSCMHMYWRTTISAPELFSQLYFFNIYACGTVWPVWHGMPEACKKQRRHHHTAAGTKHFQGERQTSCHKISQVWCPHAVHHAQAAAGKDQRRWCWSLEATLHCWLREEYRGHEWASERNIVMMDECFWINAPQWCAWQERKKRISGGSGHIRPSVEKQPFICSLWPFATRTICTARLMPSTSPIVNSECSWSEHSSVFTQCSSASWKRKEGPQPTRATDWRAPPSLQCRQMTATATRLCGMQPAEEGRSCIQLEAICLHVWTASGHLVCSLLFLGVSSLFLGVSYHKWPPANSQAAGGRWSLGWCWWQPSVSSSQWWNSVRSPCVFLTVFRCILTVFRCIIPQVTTSKFSGSRRKVVPWMVLVTTKCFFQWVLS